VSLEQEILQLVVPDVTYCLNVRLRPFSIGHLLLLKRLQSPFILSGRISYEHLLEAVFICAQTFDEGQAGLNRPDTRTVLRKFHRRISVFGFKSVAFRRGATILEEHIEKSLRFPVMYSKESSSDETELPFWLPLLINVSKNLHQPITDLLDMPIGFVYSLYAALCESMGQAQLVSRSRLDEITSTQPVLPKPSNGEARAE
jgi:hypothetical protein